MNDLEKRMEFLRELDSMKRIARRTPISDNSRMENDAEHSWHMAMFAMVLAPYAPEGCDVDRAVRMALVHDLVEIYAGDTYAYDAAAHSDKRERELAAADKLYAILPGAQGAELRGLWDEFEECATPTARFANACDRLQPLLLNYQSGGTSWMEHGIRAEQVFARNAETLRTLPELEPFVRGLVADAVARGWLAE